MDNPGPWRDSVPEPAGIVLPARRRSVALLRRYACDACAVLGWGGSADTVGLLVSEVATNAVRHCEADQRSDGEQLRVRVLDQGLRLRVEVSTVGAVDPPAVRAAGGRAHDLFVVQALALACGTQARPDATVSWFELGV